MIDMGTQMRRRAGQRTPGQCCDNLRGGGGGIQVITDLKARMKASIMTLLSSPAQAADFRRPSLDSPFRPNKKKRLLSRSLPRASPESQCRKIHIACRRLRTKKLRGNGSNPFYVATRFNTSLTSYHHST
jgi:hypothetical protein